MNAQNSSCTNSPTDRQCWYGDYNIDTDWDTVTPDTGKTVSYTFTVSNTTCNPDGHGSRICLLVNNQYPGPTITANWGDIVEVTLINEMQDNGTSFHFHGVRQLNTCGADGVSGITQCPVAPKNTYTYRFRATQYGSSWYHTHYSSQYGDGVMGAMVFNGPATANYDVDLGPLVLSDWFYQTAWQINAIAFQNLNAKVPSAPPAANNQLVNGINKDAEGAGNYTTKVITSGKSYRLRLINSAVDNYYRVSLDSHVFQVISADWVPVEPFYSEWLLIAIGQRYDVIIQANQTAGNYFFRTEVATDCGSAGKGTGLAVFSYADVEIATPSSTPFPQPSDQSCPDETPKPYRKQPVPSNNFNAYAETLDVGFTAETVFPDSGSLVVWALNNTGISVDWSDPTLSYFRNNNTDYPKVVNAFNTAAEGSWNFWVVQQPQGVPPISHPIHLHGHDYYVLGQGSGVFDYSTANLDFTNPTRRDTAALPAGGWMAMAWQANNPGAWLMREFYDARCLSFSHVY